MKTVLMKCDNCNASLKVEKGEKYSFCPYCGSQFYIDDEVKRTKHTRNINITNNKTYHEIDEARIRESEKEIKQSKYDAITTIVVSIVVLLLLAMIMMFK